MGIVTKHLFDLIAKHVEEHRLVAWYDPEKAYAKNGRSGATTPQHDCRVLQRQLFSAAA